jgi:hypothetical protein
MSSTSGLPNTGSIYPATNSDAITFSNNKPLGATSDATFSNNSNHNNDLGTSSHDATTVGIQDDGIQHRGSTIPENPINTRTRRIH